MVNDGYEGVMIKDVGVAYECKRNTFWMKYWSITVDLEVIGVEEGTGRNAGCLEYWFAQAWMMGNLSDPWVVALATVIEMIIGLIVILSLVALVKSCVI